MTYEPTLLVTSGPGVDNLFQSGSKINANLEAIAVEITDAIDGLDYQDSVLDKDLTAPPSSPVEGNRYIVASIATGAWATHEDDIAVYRDSAWEFITPNKGYCCTVEDELIEYVWNNTAWVWRPSLADALTGTAGENLDRYDLVYAHTDGKYYLASALGTEAQANAVGIVIQAGGILQDATGQIYVNPVQIINGDWSWTPNTELFLGIDGGMTHDASALAWEKPAGFAISATRILFALQAGWSTDPWLELTGDQLGIAYVPTNYTRTEVPETSSTDQISAHLAGIDARLAEIIAMIPS
jgi:hypothetical protein